MDYAKLLETLLPFLEKLLGAVTAAGHPGVGVSPVMGHLPGLHEDLNRMRVALLAARYEAATPVPEMPHPAVVAAAKAQDTADVAQDKADAAAPKARPAAQAAADVAQDKADKAQDKADATKAAAP